MNYKECIKRKSKLQSDLTLISESELAIEWGVLAPVVREEIKRLKIRLQKQAGEERFYSRQECNSKLPFLNKTHTEEESIIIPDGLMTRGDMLKRLNMSEGQFSAFIFRYGIYAIKTKYIYGKKISFFKIDQCDRAMQKELHRHKSRVDAISDKKLVTVKQLANEWNEPVNRIYPFLRKNNICAKKTITSKNNVKFYDRAECERARPFINQSEKEVEKVEKDQKIESTQLGGIFCGDIAIGRFVMVTNELDAEIINNVAGDIVCPILSTQTPQDTHTIIKNLIDNNATLLTIGEIDGRLMSIAEAVDKGADIRAIIEEGLSMKEEPIPEPKEQMPDIIPADTIDLFTMSELESELKQRGVELTAEVKAKINASTMPEMQEIATMIRGNAKTIAIRLSVLNEIAGQLKSIKNSSEEQKGLFIGALLKNCENADFYLDKELKPCPFCGMDSIVIDCEEISSGYWLARLQCSNCEVKLELDDSTKEIAADLLINQWNERPHNEDCAKTKAGAKSKYKPEFDKIAFDMASANKTDKEIMQSLNVSTDSFYRYKKEIPSFANALDSGRAANPFTITDSQGRERADRYFELKDFMEMQKQLNDMQKMIEKLVEKLEGVNITEKKMFIKNGKIDKVIVTETKMEDKK